MDFLGKDKLLDKSGIPVFYFAYLQIKLKDKPVLVWKWIYFAIKNKKC
jgi:hypothetical protein